MPRPSPASPPRASPPAPGAQTAFGFDDAFLVATGIAAASAVITLWLIPTKHQYEAKAFNQGDFGDPAQIHGDSMPGLTELQDGHKRIEVRYQECPSGATLPARTSTTPPARHPATALGVL
ncbi:hypothetical protein ACWCQQ_40260 [Streptomyces sp. NPDC002143]